MSQAGEDHPTEAPGGDPERPVSWTRPAAWLHIVEPDADVEPPSDTRPQLLPLHALSWQNFERLCLRILEADTEVVHAEAALSPETAREPEPKVRLYGTRGQAQHGIDLYARDPVDLGETTPRRRFVTLQARRVDDVSAGDLRSSVDDFLHGKWAAVTRKFIYATSSSGVSTSVTDEMERLTGELAEKGIEYELWDQEELSARLRDEPRLVDDFFGRTWVERFCGPDAANVLGERLDAGEVAELRGSLAHLYRTAFGVADSGLLALRADGRGALPLRDRFVTPDVLSTNAREAETQKALEEHPWADDDPDRIADAVPRDALWPGSDDGGPLGATTPTVARVPRAHAADAEERTPADLWLGQSSRQVVVGDPGAGKSTLLRYLILDLLSDEPAWTAVAERWGQRLPVWLPFHFFTQRVADQTGSAASVGAALKAWLQQHDFGDVWPLVEKALGDERLLLVVDGLDEWVNDDAGRYAAAAVEMFAETHGVAVVVSSRPYGLSRLTLGAGWDYGRVAPLNAEQQRSLALHYHRAAAQEDDDRATSEEALGASVDAFMAQIRASPDLRAISGVPLFLVLLVGLRLSNVARLPDRRFEVYDRAIDMLVADHPQKRRVAAAVTARRQRLTDQQTRALLAYSAFASLTRGDVSTIAESDARGDLVAALIDSDYLAMERSSAALIADELLDIAEGELGVLVRKGTRELGFVHRMIQEQLAAEYAANRLTPPDQLTLFECYVGDPQWREVLLGIVWRVQRPAELRQIVEVVEAHVDETPQGLQAREILAEATFGPYDLPGSHVHRFDAEIVDMVEGHPYDRHRSNLMASVLSGLESVTTRNTVTECLPRWTMHVRRPSQSLNWQLARLAPDEWLTEPVRVLLLAALRYDDMPIAYSAAASIAYRCGEDGNATMPERDAYQKDLLRTLSHPQSGLTAAAALTALALEWNADEPVRAALEAGRESSDEGLRIVALGHTMGVLHAGLYAARPLEGSDASEIDDDERRWLVDRLKSDGVNVGVSNVHSGLLTAAVATAIRGDEGALDYCVRRIERRIGMEVDLVLAVALRAFADSERLAEAVCNEFRTQQYPLFFRPMSSQERSLTDAYGPGSSHHDRVASAIEAHLERFGGRHRDVELHNLAAIDQGPRMRAALLQELGESSNPHWASGALSEHFLDDEEVHETLKSMLASDPAKASQIANAAPEVFDSNEAIERLLQILRGVAQRNVQRRARPDIAALALIRTCQEQDLTDGPRAETIASEAISLMPDEPHSLFGDPTYELAVAFYPSDASRSALERLAGRDDHPVEPFIAAFRDEPAKVRPFVEEAASTLRTLPVNLRARLCQLLTDRPTERALTLNLTRRWADEDANANKSVASLTYHRALLEARREHDLNDHTWDEVMAHLAEQASTYGPDHDARRRAAWVGMCVIGDWSMIDERVETIGEPAPVAVDLADALSGTDLTLVQQLASRWEELRAHFGDALMTRLSGLRERNDEPAVWAALAHGARGHPALERELEAAVADNPELLHKDGVLAWFASHAKDTDQVAQAIVSRLQSAETNLRGVASTLVMEPERIGLDRDNLLAAIEEPAQQPASGWGNPALEALAALNPNHPMIRPTWEHMQQQVQEAAEASDDFIQPLPPQQIPHPQTYLAVAYAAVENHDIVDQIARDSRWVTSSDNHIFDTALTRNVSHRLRHDPTAAETVRQAILSDATTDSLAAVLLSLLTLAAAPDQALLDAISQRTARQEDATLAPFVHDHLTSRSLPIRTILTRAADAASNSV